MERAEVVEGVLYARDHDDESALSILLPPISSWVKAKYGGLTPPQRMAIPYIKAGLNVLISSPTGTGKTLAAFLPILDELFRLGLQGRLEDRVYVVYVSPLRALNNDMQKNLVAPLSELRGAVARELGVDVDIRVAVRTSDTPPNEKSKMIRVPPHILITTPESLALALNATRFRDKLRGAKWIVIDEVHELASSKRGSHLALSVERLQDLAGTELQRVGLSATISPLEEVARFLGGYNDEGKPRPVVIVDARFTKPTDIRVVCPIGDLVYTPAPVMTEAIYNELARLVMAHRTTLVFTNTRSATERVVYRLKKLVSGNGIINADEVEAHHSSLSREVRLGVENRLKNGQLRVVVSSTSLELGIDVGYIDLVVLLSSPKSVTRLLQRIGRAGHTAYATSKGVVIVVDRDDLVECTVLAKLARERRIDRVKIPKKPLDVLAQHLVGMSLERPRTIDEVLRIVRRSYPYHDLTMEELMSVVNYLAGKLPGLEDYNVYAKVRYDEDTKTLGRRRGSRMIYQLNVGTIPDEAKVAVISIEDGKRRYVGDLEEGFVEILSPGDIFILGGKTYRVLALHPTHVVVEPAEGERPTVPSWFSEMLPLAFDSALEVGRFRRYVAELIKSLPRDKVVERISREYELERQAAEQIYDYVYQQMAVTGGLVPSDALVLVELWPEPERSATHVIFHSLFGRRVNDVLSRAYGCVLGKMLNTNVRITVTDNGFMLTIPTRWLGEEVVRRALREVGPHNVEELVRAAVRRTELFKKRFRHCAERAFLLLRRYKGSEVSLARRQVNAEKVIEAVERYPRFPVIEEAYREILEDFMDLTHAREVLSWVSQGKVKVEIIVSRFAPSPFAHSIIAHGYSDVVLMEDRRKLIARLQDLVRRAIVAGAPP